MFFGNEAFSRSIQLLEDLLKFVNVLGLIKAVALNMLDSKADPARQQPETIRL